MFVYISILVATVLFMEFFAILTHKYIMHGPGWFLHKSHHVKNVHKSSKFELNDLYFVIFSIPSIVSIVYGFLNINYFFLSVGFGMLVYGLIYLLFHDIIVHKRFGFKFKAKGVYAKKVISSHMKHHACKSKKGATNFGFLSYK
jgi:beta-carotene 3-hydroxylase